MTTCTWARALLFLQRSTFLNTVNLIIIGCNGIRNQMFLDTCIVQAERNVTIKKTMQNIGGKPGNTFNVRILRQSSWNYSVFEK